jgi:hypothetical protein
VEEPGSAPQAVSPGTAAAANAAAAAAVERARRAGPAALGTAASAAPADRRFGVFWLGQSVSQFGDRISELALPLIADCWARVSAARSAACGCCRPPSPA